MVMNSRAGAARKRQCAAPDGRCGGDEVARKTGLEEEEEEEGEEEEEEEEEG